MLITGRMDSGNVLKPSLDLILFTSQLSRTLGFRGTFLLGLNYYVTARILRAATPAFGRLAAVEAQLEEIGQKLSRPARPYGDFGQLSAEDMKLMEDLCRKMLQWVR